MKAIIRLPRAIADLDDIWYYIARDNPDAAFRTVQRISEATARLRDHPFSGPALEGTEIQDDLRIPIHNLLQGYRSLSSDRPRASLRPGCAPNKLRLASA